MALVVVGLHFCDRAHCENESETKSKMPTDEASSLAAARIAKGEALQGRPGAEKEGGEEGGEEGTVRRGEEEGHRRSCSRFN